MKMFVRRLAPVILAVLICLIGMVAFTTLTHMQGNARVVNYTGLARGATQQLVKQEMNGVPNDELIHFLDGIMLELSTGEGENGLIAIPDTDYQELMTQMGLFWEEIKREIGHVRQGGDQQQLFQLSETHFALADQAVSAAEQYSESRVSSAISILLCLSAGFAGLLVLLWIGGQRQKKVQMALELAESANQAKSEFLSRMSHEIRTPMNGIIGMTDIARRSADDPERVMDCLNKIDLSSSYLLALLNDILDMSRIESGKVELVYRTFELPPLFERVYGMFRHKAESSGVTLQVLYDDLTVSTVVGDDLRLSQVLVNLVSNAMKFTPAGGGVTLAVSQEAVSDQAVTLVFTVTDTGVGISEAFQARLFEPFEQEQSATVRQYGGTGLGLAIASNFVKMMGGEISVQSKLGEGACFTVSLTLRRPDWQAAVVTEAGSQPGAAGQEEDLDLTGIGILLAEDNEINAEIVTCLLEERGAQVTRVGNGQAAVEQLSQTPAGTYTLILMDIQMPVMNGVEAARAIRGLSHPDGPGIPIIGLSANAFRDDIDRALASGMDGYLSKPIALDRLYQTLDEILVKKKGEQ